MPYQWFNSTASLKDSLLFWQSSGVVQHIPTLTEELLVVIEVVFLPRSSLHMLPHPPPSWAPFITSVISGRPKGVPLTYGECAVNAELCKIKATSIDPFSSKEEVRSWFMKGGGVADTLLWIIGSQPGKKKYGVGERILPFMSDAWF